jgi:hypothetical protein
VSPYVVTTLIGGCYKLVFASLGIALAEIPPTRIDEEPRFPDPAGDRPPARADAAPRDTLPNPVYPVYLQVGDTPAEPHGKRLGRALRDSTQKPITLVFVTSGSCTNIPVIYTRVPIAMPGLW